MDLSSSCPLSLNLPSQETSPSSSLPPVHSLTPYNLVLCLLLCWSIFSTVTIDFLCISSSRPSTQLISALVWLASSSSCSSLVPLFSIMSPPIYFFTSLTLQNFLGNTFFSAYLYNISVNSEFSPLHLLCLGNVIYTQAVKSLMDGYILFFSFLYLCV